MNPLARHACPGIAVPMLTGDGLLARINIDSAIDVAVFDAVCAASQRHGNGIMEITRRGSLQVRGLSESSAPVFAHEIISLGLDRDGPPQIITSPLLGFDPHEAQDLRTIVADLRGVVSDQHYRTTLSPKVAVVIDGGGAIDLNEISADVRVRATSAGALHLSLAGTAYTATHLGWVGPRSAVGVVDTLLEAIATCGSDKRAAHLLQERNLDEIRAASLPQQLDAGVAMPGAKGDAIGIHALHAGFFARGFALPFGFTTAAKLMQFARLAEECGASQLRPAPGRAMLAIGLSSDGAERLFRHAADLGFITDPHDPRRSIAACAGAPACSSARLPTRELAERLAMTAGPLMDGSFTVHLSGCTKGCAHSSPAAITLTGPDRLIFDGRAGDAPHGVLPSDVTDALKRMLMKLQSVKHVDESMADTMSRVGVPQMLDLMSMERRGG